MDLFDVAAKLTIDSSNYENGIADAIAASGKMNDALVMLQTEYNQASAEAKVLQKALAQYTSETGSASGAGEELAAMLAEQQLRAADAKEQIQELKTAQSEAAQSASELGNSADDASFGIEGVGNSAEETEGDLVGARIETENFTDILISAGSKGVSALSSIASAASSLTQTISDLTGNVADYGDHIDKMSQKMGISAEAYQEWDAVLQHEGTSIDSLRTSMRTLANAVENNNDAFSRLGITQSEIASMNQEELFSATITALQNVDDVTERTYLAGQLLGRGATELGPLLNKTAEETEEMKQRVHELGGVMSDEAVAASARFVDEMQDLKTSISGLGRNMSSVFLPGINDVIAGFTSLIIGEEGAKEKIIDGMSSVSNAVTTVIPQITEIVSSIGSAFVQMAPELVKAGVQLINSLLNSFISNTGEIGKTAASIIETLVNGLAQTAPLLITGAFALISELANSLGEALPTLLPTVVNMVMQMALALTDPSGLSAILNGALSLMQGLANGILAALPLVINTIPVLIQNLIDFIVQNLPQFLVQGTQIIIQLAVGIIQAIPDLLSKLPEILDALVNGLIELAPQLWEAGKQMAGEIWNGIKSIFGGKKQEQINVADSIDFGGVTADAQQTATTVSTAFSGMNTSLDLSAVSTSATTQFDAISASATTAKDNVVASFTGMGTEIGNSIASGQGNVDWSALEAGAKTAAANMKAAFTSFPATMRSNWTKIKSYYTEVPTWLAKQFTVAKENIMSTWSIVPDEFRAIWTSIKTTFNDADTYFKSVGTKMHDNLMDGLDLDSIENEIVNATGGGSGGTNNPAGGNKPMTRSISRTGTSNLVTDSSSLEKRVEKIYTLLSAYIPEIAEKTGVSVDSIDNALGFRSMMLERGNA